MSLHLNTKHGNKNYSDTDNEEEMETDNTMPSFSNVSGSFNYSLSILNVIETIFQNLILLKMLY